MDKYEKRRVALQKLVESIGKGAQAKISEEIGVSASYLSRMLYPEGKKGKKNIGEDTATSISEKYPQWMPLPAATPSVFTPPTTDQLIESLVDNLTTEPEENLDFALAKIKMLVIKARRQAKPLDEEAEFRKRMFRESVQELQAPRLKESPERKVSNGGQ